MCHGVQNVVSFHSTLIYFTFSRFEKTESKCYAGDSNNMQQHYINSDSDADSYYKESLNSAIM